MPSPRPTASAALASLRRLADPARAEFVARFFKTGPGEYGEGDKFIGLSVPQTRSVAKVFRNLPLSQTLKLLKHKIHEARLLALLILVDQHGREDEARRLAIFNAYLAHTRFINNWDLVDLSAPSIIGPHVDPADLHLLEILADSPLLWERRIAMLATHHWIRRGQPRPALCIARRLLGDKHDLMHKAVGWMLREVGKRDLPALESFLAKHAANMPRTALRYAIERFPERRRKAILRRTPPIF